MTTLETERLILKPLAPAHLLALIAGDAEFVKAFGAPAAPGLGAMFRSAEVSPVWLAELRASSDAPADPFRFGFAIVDRVSPAMIGTVGFKGAADADGVVEIAYGVAADVRGRGLATEATAAGVQFAFGHANVRTVRAHSLASNPASIRVLEKCGFAYIGVVDDPDDGRVRRYEIVRDTHSHAASFRAAGPGNPG